MPNLIYEKMNFRRILRAIMYRVKNALSRARNALSRSKNTLSRAKNAVSTARKKVEWILLNSARQWRRQRIRALEKNAAPVTLFVATEAGLLPNLASHAILARVLADAGHPAIILSCDGLLPVCSVKFSMGLRPTASNDIKNLACIECRKSAASVGHSYGLVDTSINKVLDAKRIAEIEGILAANSQSLWETKYDGVDFGTACLGETMRAVRKSSMTEFAPDDHVLLKAIMHTSLAIYFAVRVLSQQFNIERIAYYGDYAYHLPLVLLGARRGIAVTHISHGYSGDIDQRLVSIRPGFVFSHVFELLDRWTEYRDRSIDPENVDQILEDALFRLSGHGGISTFSPNWIHNFGDTRKDLGLDLTKKTIVAFASSMDEIECTHHFMKLVGLKFDDVHDPFFDQNQWLKELISWVGARSDIQLLLRLHPRMASSARFTTSTSDYGHMKTMLSTLPSNVFVEWPDSKISSYNLAEIADVVLTAWSSMAIELSKLGIPVVSAFPKIGLVPTGRFIMTGQTPEDYFKAIDRLLDSESSIDAITEAFRWAQLLYWSHLVDLSDLVPKRNYNKVPSYRTPQNSQVIVDVLASHKDIVALNMSRYNDSAASALAEKAAVIRSIEVIVGLLASGQRLKTSQGLRVESDAGDLIYQSANHNSGDFTLRIADNGTMTLPKGGTSEKRYSKLVQRLALLLGSLKREGASNHSKLLVNSQ